MLPGKRRLVELASGHAGLVLEGFSLGNLKN